MYKQLSTASSLGLILHTTISLGISSYGLTDPTNMSKTVAIYGATAFSAGPAIEYLVNHPDTSQFNLILAGRNRDKLANVHSKLCKGKEVETVALELSDEQGVKDLVDKADVVMNFAGMRDISYRWEGRRLSHRSV